MHYFMLLFYITTTQSLVFSEADLIDEAVLIASKVYTKNRLTTVISSQDQQDYVNDFLKHYNATAVTIAIKKNVNLNSTEFRRAAGLYHQTVFFAQEAPELKYFLQIIKNNIVVSIRVILVIANKNIGTETFSEFTKIAWEEDITDLILLGYSTDGTLEIKTYYPYSGGVCDNITPVNLKRFTSNYFTSKFKNLYGCPIKAAVVDFMPYVKVTKQNNTVIALGGIDGNILKLIVEILNASINITSAHELASITAVVNGTRTGTFYDLVNGIGDIMVPSIIMTPKRHQASQISFSYNVINVAWCLPTRREIHEWARIFLPFLNYTTPLIVLTFLIILILIKLVEKFGIINNPPQKGTVFAMFGMFLGQGVKVSMRHWFVKCIFTSWLWFCLIVRISYQGNLIDGLRKMILEPPIETLSDAVAVVEEIGGLATFLEFYRNTSLDNKYKPLNVKEVPAYMKEIGAGKRFLLAADMMQVKYYRQNLQILDERVTSLPSCIHLRPRWSAAPVITELIMKLFQFGLIEKLWKNLHNDWSLEHRNEIDSKQFQPLGLKAVSSCFYGYIFMTLISLIIFIIEIILGRRKKNLIMEKSNRVTKHFVISSVRSGFK